MERWGPGPSHDAEHDRIVRELTRHERTFERLRLTSEERRAVQTAAAKMVADEALSANRARRRPIWQDRRAMVGLVIQAIVAFAVLLTLLHNLNPSLP